MRESVSAGLSAEMWGLAERCRVMSKLCLTLEGERSEAFYLRIVSCHALRTGRGYDLGLGGERAKRVFVRSASPCSQARLGQRR